MAKKKLIIYDDEKTHAKRYTDMLENIKEVNNSYNIISYDNDEFKSVYKILKKRRSDSRDNNEQEWNDEEIDNAAIMIIDYDLVEAHSEIPDNGEEIAYYVRMFSKCDYVILLNRFGHKTFDLNLTGHIDSYADINIGMEDLNNQGLWTGRSDGYKPWYWPSLISVQENYSKRFSDVRKHFRESLKDFFGLADSFFYSLSQSSLQHLGMDRENIEKTTFEDFFNNSDMILKGRDEECGFSDEMKAQIVASRLSKWFERTVIPGQDVLVDCPHLVSRFPSLVNDTGIKVWDKTAIVDDFDALPIHKKVIDKYMFKKNYWLSRPCWIWDLLSECKDILEIFEPWKKMDIPFVFTEDASSFHPKEKCREFVSAVDSPFRKRYVYHFDDEDVKYRPKVRLYADE